MRNGKYTKRGVASKTLIMVLALVMVLGCGIGGTLAWLTDSTEKVENTFTTSDIDITLTETKEEYKMVPGYTIHKDPKATVVAGSEACWLFVKFEKSENFDNYMEYKVADGWAPLEGVDGVYCREVAASEANQEFKVLANDQVTVKGTVTKDMMETAEASKPTLTFTAYASQLMKNNTEKFSATEAWANLNPQNP